MNFEEFLRARCPDSVSGQIFLTKVLIEPTGVFLYVPSDGALAIGSSNLSWMGEVRGGTLIPDLDVAEINPHSVPAGEAA